MKRAKSIKVMAVAGAMAATLALSGTAMARGGHHGGFDVSNTETQVRGIGSGVMLSQLPYEELSQEEIDALIKMREEEKLARDVYTYLFDLWGSAIFANISASEQRHMDAVGALIEKYGLDDPVAGLDYGQFATDEMQQLYQELTSKGQESLEAALQVGATIEDLDIKDLLECMEAVDNQDIMFVFQNLTKGSRNHLRAFVSSLEAMGSSYTAQFLTQDEVDAIVNSDWERGPVDQDGNPISNGRGGKGRMGCCRGGLNNSGSGFVDADGDGICDNLEMTE
jgi:hypothetical protein